MAPFVFIADLAFAVSRCDFFFFNDTATTEIYPLSLHDALPICPSLSAEDIAARANLGEPLALGSLARYEDRMAREPSASGSRSEEHTSELQSQSNLVCRLLLEKKKREPPPDACRAS